MPMMSVTREARPIAHIALAVFVAVVCRHEEARADGPVWGGVTLTGRVSVVATVDKSVDPGCNPGDCTLSKVHITSQLTATGDVQAGQIGLSGVLHGKATLDQSLEYDRHPSRGDPHATTMTETMSGSAPDAKIAVELRISGSTYTVSVTAPAMKDAQYHYHMEYDQPVDRTDHNVPSSSCTTQPQPLPSKPGPIAGDATCSALWAPYRESMIAAVYGNTHTDPGSMYRVTWSFALKSH